MYQRLLYRYQRAFSVLHRDSARLIPQSFFCYVKLHDTVLANDIWVEVMPATSFSKWLRGGVASLSSSRMEALRRSRCEWRGEIEGFQIPEWRVPYWVHLHWSIT